MSVHIITINNMISKVFHNFEDAKQYFNDYVQKHHAVRTDANGFWAQFSDGRVLKLDRHHVI